MEKSTFKKIKMFANSIGSVSWRCISSNTFTTGDIVEVGRYRCNKCGFVECVDRFDDEGSIITSGTNTLKQCEDCG